MNLIFYTNFELFSNWGLIKFDGRNLEFVNF